MGVVQVRGLEALEGETAFAFLVVRLRRATPRDGVIELLRYIAPFVPDAEAFIEDFPEDLEDSIRILGVPWSPPEAGHAVDAQRRLIESAASVGVEAAWFFQTGTSLPTDEDDEDERDDDDGSDADEDLEGDRGRARPSRTDPG